MTAKDYLLEYARLQEDLIELTEDIAALESLATGTTASIDGMPGSGRTGDKVGTGASRIADKKRDKERLIAAIIAQREEIRQLVRSLTDPRHRRLISLRYLEMEHGRLRTWERVAESMHYDVDWVRGGLHSQALDAVQAILDNNTQKHTQTL